MQPDSVAPSVPPQHDNESNRPSASESPRQHTAHSLTRLLQSPLHRRRQFSEWDPKHREALIRAAVNLVRLLSPDDDISHSEFLHCVALRLLEEVGGGCCSHCLDSRLSPPKTTSLTSVTPQGPSSEQQQPHHNLLSHDTTTTHDNGSGDEQTSQQKRRCVMVKKSRSFRPSPPPVRYDILPPDVVCSCILPFLLARLSVKKHKWAQVLFLKIENTNEPKNDDGAGGMDWYRTAAKDSYRFPSSSSSSTSARRLPWVGLYGYFCRDGLRYPWFLFRSISLHQSARPGTHVVLTARQVMYLELNGFQDEKLFGKFRFPSLPNLETLSVEKASAAVASKIVGRPQIANASLLKLSSVEPVTICSQWKGRRLDFGGKLSLLSNLSEFADRLLHLSVVLRRSDDVLPLLPSLTHLHLRGVVSESIFKGQIFGNLRHLVIDSPKSEFLRGWPGCDFFTRLVSLSLHCSLSDRFFKIHSLQSLRDLKLISPRHHEFQSSFENWAFDPVNLTSLTLQYYDSDDEAELKERTLDFFLSKTSNLAHLNLVRASLKSLKTSWQLDNLRTLRITEDGLNDFEFVHPLIQLELLQMETDDQWFFVPEGWNPPCLKVISLHGGPGILVKQDPSDDPTLYLYRLPVSLVDLTVNSHWSNTCDLDDLPGEVKSLRIPCHGRDFVNSGSGDDFFKRMADTLLTCDLPRLLVDSLLSVAAVLEKAERVEPPKSLVSQLWVAEALFDTDISIALAQLDREADLFQHNVTVWNHLTRQKKPMRSFPVLRICSALKDVSKACSTLNKYGPYADS